MRFQSHPYFPFHSSLCGACSVTVAAREARRWGQSGAGDCGAEPGGANSPGPAPGARSRCRRCVRAPPGGRAGEHASGAEGPGSRARWAGAEGAVGVYGAAGTPLSRGTRCRRGPAPVRQGVRAPGRTGPGRWEGPSPSLATFGGHRCAARQAPPVAKPLSCGAPGSCLSRPSSGHFGPGSEKSRVDFRSETRRLNTPGVGRAED